MHEGKTVGRISGEYAERAFEGYEELRKLGEQRWIWILSQCRLLSESHQEGILLSLPGEKKIIDMPTSDEIYKFCERVENGEIYFEYETHYYEFDDDGRYMDNWKIWHNDVFGVIPFLDRVFAGCHDLLRLEEYGDVVRILDRVCELEFPVETAEDSEDQPEIDTIQDICEALIKNGKLEQEDWKIRKKVLADIIQNEYYDYYSCGDVMEELAKKLCTNREEYLAYADIMDASGQYRERAAYLYYEYGKDDKYISYLESHLGRRSKEYSALITYYQEHDQQEEACRVAELGLERCKEDLTDCFICLILEAQKNGDEKQFQKLYASAKQRKHVEVEKIKRVLEQLD